MARLTRYAKGRFRMKPGIRPFAKRRSPPSRSEKCFLWTWQGIETGYRIASFLALGLLLVAALLLYQKYFRSALADWAKARGK